MPDFSKSDITVTLTGEEWFAIMVKLARKPLSPYGRRCLQRAQKRLGDQLAGTAATFPREEITP